MLKIPLNQHNQYFLKKFQKFVNKKIYYQSILNIFYSNDIMLLE